MPEKVEKYIAQYTKMVIGGGAANAAIAIARQLGAATLAARIGDDRMGKAVLQMLENEKVDCSLLHKWLLTASDAPISLFETGASDDASTH